MNLTNILRSGILCANTESDNEIFIDVCGHHMEFSRGIDRRQKLLIQLTRAEKPKADQSNLELQSRILFSGFPFSKIHLDVVHQPEPVVILHLGLELLGQPAVVPHVLLEPGHSEVPDDEPELQGTEPSAERNAPVL